MMPEPISPRRMRAHLGGSDPVTVVDTRPADNFEEWRIPGSVNVPNKPTEPVDIDAVETALPPTVGTLITVCALGKSSHAFARALEAHGYGPVHVVDEGMEGWSRYYDRVAVPLGDGVDCWQLQRVAKGCLSYLLACPESDATLVIDPPRHLDPIDRLVDEAGLDIVAVWDSHVHADHVSGGPMLAEREAVPYLMPEAALDRGLDRDIEPVAAGEQIEVGSLTLEVIPTPGHTTDIASLHLDGVAVFTADTLFIDAVGRTELEDANAAKAQARQLYASITERLFALDPDTTVLPGHFDPDEEVVTAPPSPMTTSIGSAREEIDVLDLDREAFVDRIVDTSASRPPNYEDIISINLGQKRRPDEAGLTELELGPNRCAASA